MAAAFDGRSDEWFVFFDRKDRPEFIGNLKMIYEILTQPEFAFLRAAFLLSAAASIAFGFIGTFVVVRRIGYLAGAISHCAFGGIGFGIWLKQAVAAGALGIGCLISNPTQAAEKIDPVIVAVFAAIIASLLIGVIKERTGEREDTLIGLLWSVGMAIGLLFLDKTTGYASSVSSYLFGDAALVSVSDLKTVAILSGCVLLICTCFFKQLEAICFDEEFAKLENINVKFYFQLLLMLTAVTVVLMLRIVGILLVIALLTLPPAAAGQLTRRLGPMIGLAVFFCFFGSWLGIYLSFLFDFSVGPMIIIVVALMYMAAVLAGRLLRKKSV